MSSSRLLSSSHWERHCRHILLHCLVLYLVCISEGLDLHPFPWRDYSRQISPWEMLCATHLMFSVS